MTLKFLFIFIHVWFATLHVTCVFLVSKNFSSFLISVATHFTCTLCSKPSLLHVNLNLAVRGQWVDLTNCTAITNKKLHSYLHSLQLTTYMSSLYQWYSTGGTRTPGGTRRHLRGYVDYTICITCNNNQQLWRYKVEEKLYLGVREQKRLNTTGLYCNNYKYHLLFGNA
jgi:hypothetical protein